MSFKWNYEPKGIISKKRQNVRLVDYLHHRHEMLDKIANLKYRQDVKSILHP